MKLFSLLQALDHDVAPEHCKIHLATWNGREHPLDVYLAGEFDAWQAIQTQRNFERPLVVSLIDLREPNRWLFAGIHESHGATHDPESTVYRYDMRCRDQSNEFDGRLIVRFERRGRTSYLLAENWTDDLLVDEVRPEKLRYAEFPGYSRVLLSKQHLDLIVRQGIASWKTALSHVAGVYVISDRLTGRLYVGSATGQEGLWSRWRAYSSNGHGGNRELRDLLSEKGERYADNFQYSVLEIADTHTSDKDVLEREAYWKSVLLSRDHGLNRN